MAMAKTTVPPGFRFHPTDVELVQYYLKRKVMGKPFLFEAISVVELYKFAPWDLPDKSCLQSKDLEWYFFCPRNMKYAHGSRMNRSTEAGFWKVTGKDKSISYNSQTVGMRRTLVFHVCKASKGDRTNWVMHEYRLEGNHLVHTGFSQDAYVLCKIFQKSGPGPKNGEQYGALFREEDWEDNTVYHLADLNPPLSPPVLLDDSHHLSDNVLQSGTPRVSDTPSCSPEYLNVDQLLLDLLENNNDTSGVLENVIEEVSDSVMKYLELPNSVLLHDGALESGAISDSNEIYNGLEFLSSQVDLNSGDDACCSNDVDKDNAFQHTEFGLDDGSYMELKDLQFPAESEFSEPSISSTLLGCYLSDHEDWNNMVGSRNNTSWEYIADVHESVPCQTTEEIGNGYFLQSIAGGEQHRGKPYGVFQCLLGSLHSRPAIAAEFPSALKEMKSGGSVLYYGSPIHVSSEVTFRSLCGGQTGDTSSTCCHGHTSLRKIAKDARDGFLFMFVLGMISASMWIFLLTMGVKLGKGAWKLLLS